MKNMHFRGRKSIHSFATVHKSLDELQGAVKEQLEKNLSQSEKIQTIISAPSQLIQKKEARIKMFVPWKTTPSWVLVMTDQRMLIVSVPQSQTEPQLHAFSFDNILTMEFGRILLFAWLEWVWAGESGAERVKVYFNSVDDNRYQQLVLTACRKRIEKEGLKAITDKRNLELLKDLPFKFHNIITIELLLDDEAIQSLVFQPAIYDKLFGLFRSLRSPAMALVRTNYHLLTMREDEGDAGSRYGVVFRYMPLDVIQHAEMIQEDNFLKVLVHLQKDEAQERIQMEFLPEQEQDLRQLLTAWLKD